MKPIFETIDGMTFAFVKDETGDPCHNCVLFTDKKRCVLSELCGDFDGMVYRHLTAEEIAEVKKNQKGDAE